MYNKLYKYHIAHAFYFNKYKINNTNLLFLKLYFVLNTLKLTKNMYINNYA